MQYEYTVEQKCEGKWKLYKSLMLSLYFLYTLAYFIAIYVTRIIPLGALIPVTLWILVFFTWRYVKPEYKYEIDGAHLTFTVIYGGRTKKVKAKIKLCEAHTVLPLPEASGAIGDFSPEVIFNALPTVTEPDAYVMLYTREDGKRCELVFKATQDGLKAIRFYNKNVKITQTAL